MLITENFALLNILQTLEKLSAASKGKMAAKGEELLPQAEDGQSDTPAAARKSAENATASDTDGKGSYEYTRMLLERHERLVNNIRNGKK